MNIVHLNFPFTEINMIEMHSSRVLPMSKMCKWHFLICMNEIYSLKNQKEKMNLVNSNSDFDSEID
jgi:hypothetical protein